MTSAKPSLFTSPAPATDQPFKSFAAAPSIRNPAEPRLAKSTGVVGVADPYTTYADPESVRALLSALGAPMMTSSKPSLFTSPAPATNQPLRSFAAAPLMVMLAWVNKSIGPVIAFAEVAAAPVKTPAPKTTARPVPSSLSRPQLDLDATADEQLLTQYRVIGKT